MVYLEREIMWSGATQPGFRRERGLPTRELMYWLNLNSRQL
jgi:hypothetical protein